MPDSGYEEISAALIGSKEVDLACISLFAEVHMIKTLGGELGAKINEDCEHDQDSII